jgi:hypothetical protein
MRVALAHPETFACRFGNPRATGISVRQEPLRRVIVRMPGISRGILFTSAAASLVKPLLRRR